MTILGAILASVAVAIVLLLLTKQGRAVIDYAKRDEMPIWLSLSLALATAAGTYFIAPLINQDFENQKSRSEHLLPTVEQINDLNVGIAVGIRKFNDSLFYGSKDIEKVKGDVLDKITKSQWRLIDVDAIIRRAEPDNNCATTMSKDLDGLRDSVIDATKPIDQEKVINSAVKAADSSRKCTIMLYRAAKL